MCREIKGLASKLAHFHQLTLRSNTIQTEQYSEIAHSSVLTPHKHFRAIAKSIRVLYFFPQPNMKQQSKNLYWKALDLIITKLPKLLESSFQMAVASWKCTEVYRSYAHFQFSPYKSQLHGNIKALGLCWTGLHGNTFCMKRNHWGMHGIETNH